jgi:diguanylate cyclase (GGDEF)-like protein
MKKLSATLWFIQLLLLHSLLTPSQATAKTVKPLNEYAMRTWTTAHGLPHNSVNAITQSADGYLWLATWEGPVRYNGREFKVFDDIQITQMPEAGALDIHVHPNTGDMIVAGPRGGVVFFNGQQWRPLQFGSGYAYETVVDDLQRLWVATSAGVYRLDSRGEVELFDVTKGLPDNTTIRIALVSDANNQQQIWAGTRGGLAVFEPSTERFTKVNELPTAQIREIRQLQDGRIAVSSDDGLFIQQSSGEFTPWPVAVKGPITAITEGPEGCLWVGTFEYGVGRLCADQQEWLSVDQGLPNSHVLDIFRDRENNMWVSTHGGFAQFRAALFTSFTPHHGLKGAYARSVHVDNEGTIWVGTNDGLSYRKNGRFIGLDKEARLKALSVLSIASDDANRLYVGSYTEGVLQLQDGRITAQLNRDNGLMLNEIRVVKPIPGSDYVLVGTPNGLYVTEVRNGQFVIVKHFTSADGMASDFVHSLTLAPNGDLWVSSTSTLTHFKTSNSRFDWKPEAVNLEEFTRARNIFSGIIHQQRLWLATDQGVLTRDLSSGTWQWLGRQQGLPFEKVFTINFDTQANLWLGGSRGIIRVSAEQLEQWLSEEIKLVTHKLFSEADGMKSRQITTGGLASALDTEGHLWFASAVGAVRVDPSQYNAHENSAPPPVIESVTHDYGVLEATAELPADNTRTAFNYVALGYQMPEQIEYQVRMYGYDTQWINREDNLTTEYTALPPGNYRFAVRTRYQGENWSQPTEFSFSKAAYFYQRPWFWFVFVIALITLVGGIVHWRIRQLEKLRVRLQAMVHQQTLELEQLALTDSLTGLANRRAFDQRLALEVKNSTRHQTPLSVGLLDLDYFKEINDKYLHAGGDIILTQVAKLIATNARETDLVARWGGEEFTIIFPDTTQAQAAKILERIRLMVEQLEVPEVSDEARVTVSIGLVSNQSAMSSDAQQLLKLADRMLYQAKKGGRNRLSIYQADDISG